MAACIVVWDDEQGGCYPFSLDDNCDGALSATNGPVALFPDRKKAQRAIRISVKYAELCEAQGGPANDDFLGDARKHAKIRPCV